MVRPAFGSGRWNRAKRGGEKEARPKSGRGWQKGGVRVGRRGERAGVLEGKSRAGAGGALRSQTQPGAWWAARSPGLRRGSGGAAPPAAQRPGRSGRFCEAPLPVHWCAHKFSWNCSDDLG